MDPTQLASELVKILTPYLPALLAAGTAGGIEVAKGAAGKVGEKFVEQIWDKLHPKVQAKRTANAIVQDLAEDPKDTKLQDALRGQIETILEDKTLAAELQPLVIQYNTLTQNIRKGGIDFVGDTKIKGDVAGESIYHAPVYNAPVTYTLPPESLKDASISDLERAYYRSLADECAKLPLGTVHPRFLETARESDVGVANVYIDLDVTPPVRERDTSLVNRLLKRVRKEEQEPETPRRIPVLAALARADLTRIVLLGDMGSGKSTCVQYLAFALAQLRAGDARAALLPENSPLAALFPVRLILRHAAPFIPENAPHGGDANMLWNALRADFVERLGEDAAAKLFPIWRDRVLSQPALVLLDGLDEVPEADQRRAHLLQAIQKFVGALSPQSRVVVTARPYAYTDERWKLATFIELNLEPFSDDQIKRFIERWYQAIRPAQKWDEPTAAAKAQDLIDALDARPDLGDIATRPLLLTLMATVASTWGTLPNDRFALYEEMVNLFLSRWQHLSDVRDELGKLIIEPGTAQALSLEQVLRQALNQLALNVHTRQSLENPTAAPSALGNADISDGEIYTAFAPLLADNINPAALLRYLDTRAGLLISRKQGVYVFPHRSFQEYLAASALSNLPNSPRELRTRVYRDPRWWRDVFLWSAGIKSRGGQDSDNVVSLVNALVPNIPVETPNRTLTNDRAAVLAALALQELKTKPHGDETFDATLMRIQKWLVELIAPVSGTIPLPLLPAPERAEAANVLASLGDPRPGVLSSLLLCEIPAGPFWLGSSKNPRDPHFDSEASNQELGLSKPYEKLTRPFYLSRYPITNAQFNLFLDDPDGFSNPAWWQGLAQCDNASRPRKYGGVFDLPNHPVVGVTWYQSVAYCRWLDARVKSQNVKPVLWGNGNTEPSSFDLDTFTLRLPTEAEWEKAAAWDPAKNQKRKYPWGDTITPDHANYDETSIRATSAVGCFPNGASPYGVLDLSGNVWEWCSTKWVANYDNYQQTEDNTLTGDEPRVGRGGSFGDIELLVRCACRDRDNPLSWLSYPGFRVVVAPV